MVRTITIQDNGSERYTITASTNILGRMYDNNAESITVVYPQAEVTAGHSCTMIVTLYGKTIDHINVENGVAVPINSNLSQYQEVKVSFSFFGSDNYIKNSETKTFKFLEAQKPDDFVPTPAIQSGNIDALIHYGFVNVVQENNYIIFYNLANEEVKRISIVDAVGSIININGVFAESVNFDSDPQLQITTINEAIGLIEIALGGKASVQYVDNKFNGANKAISYGDYETMITAFNALDDDAYVVGQNVYIITREVPDLWISSVEETSVSYTYVDDTTFVSALATNGYVQVGYYKFSALETQKVDLTNYEVLSNKVTSLSNQSTDQQYPSAKTVYDVFNSGVPYLTTAPISANTSGNLKIVVLSSEPATRYDGYIYLIKE